MLCLSAILTFKCYDIPCLSAILTFNSSLLLTGIVHMFKCYDIPCLSAMDIPRFTRNMTLCFVFYMFKCYAMDIPRFTRNICTPYSILRIPYSVFHTISLICMLSAPNIPRFTRNIL